MIADDQESVCLEIDGIEYCPSVASTMYQDDPFPGGHRYHLLVPIGLIDLSWLPFEVKTPPAGDIASELLGALTRVLRGKAKEYSMFYLNSVERLVVIPNDRVELWGVCSEHVQTPGEPYC
jgi:hypothetical protein